MEIDVLFDPFGGRWSDLRDGVVAAAQAGLGGLWLYDHLAGSVHHRSHVLECWTILSAIAPQIPEMTVGPLVLNVANRDPGTLAVMVATLQEVSGGRLLLGLGAGGGRDTPYAEEQEAFGRGVDGDVARRQAVADTVAVLRSTWSGTVKHVSGFLRPDPPVPVIIGGFGPRMARLAGEIGDGMNAPSGPRLGRLVSMARDAFAARGNDPSRFVVTASAGTSPREHETLAEIGVDRAIVYVAPPYLDGVKNVARSLRPS